MPEGKPAGAERGAEMTRGSKAKAQAGWAVKRAKGDVSAGTKKREGTRKRDPCAERRKRAFAGRRDRSSKPAEGLVRVISEPGRKVKRKTPFSGFGIWRGRSISYVPGRMQHPFFPLDIVSWSVAVIPFTPPAICLDQPAP